MKLFKQIRLNIGNKILLKRLPKNRRAKKICNFDNAKHIGIVFATNAEHEWIENKQFIEYLQNKNFKVSVLAYLQNKKLIEYYKRISNVDFFSDKELDFFFIPKKNYNFTNIKFDILIDLSFDIVFPLTYIIAMSKSGFKVGIMNKIHNYYDFMIDLGTLKNKSLYIEQIKHYLTLLNKEEINL
jgi:hypothetical protein